MSMMKTTLLLAAMTGLLLAVGGALGGRSGMTIALVMAGAISWVAHPFMLMGGGDDDSPNPIAAIAMMILAPLAAMMIQMAVSRSREYGADETGARLVGYP